MRTTIGLSLALLLVSAVAWAKQVHVAHHRPHSTEGVKTKHSASVAAAERARATHLPPAAPHSEANRTRATAALRAKAIRLAEARRLAHRQAARLPSPDRYIGSLRIVGPAEVGTAAWYGGRHLGERTASGERLDAIHATAAHRWLPLHSLVRVTNLRNGRSAIATINDRGPVSHSLLIDLSPRVAKELDMMHAGIARVSIVPVAATTRQTR
jgi:rare lipoprotein A